MNAEDRIFCALDTPDIADAEALAGAVAGSVGGLKLGLEFFGAQGPAGIIALKETGQNISLPIFLDLKLHDIPNTVAGAVRSLAPLGVKMLTIHTQGGPEMMRRAAEAAAEGAANSGTARPLVIGVTILTSLDGDDLTQMGVSAAPSDQVRRLAEMAQKSGLDGIVCSPLEISAVRGTCGDEFTLVVPGIRPAGADIGDQKRVMTPAEAVNAGADYLVIGRPITGAADPAAAARDIAASLSETDQS